jgi:2-polyprenyl-3-methyl-5-hydroxy-6-metoxy-1,4-benzoquinol methylase
MNESLNNYRLYAAKSSGGTSPPTVRYLVLKMIHEYNLRGSVLDYGAGKGELLQKLDQEGRFTKLSGIDLFERPTALPKSIDWHSQDLNEDIHIETDQYDVIICSEVIEHLENPRQVFRNIHRLLRHQGTLILTMPNQESVRSFAGLLIGGHFASFLEFHYPAHITALLRLDLSRICSETGFEKPTFYYTNHGGLPKLTSVTWQTISLGLLRGRFFSDYLGMLTRKSIPSHNSHLDEIQDREC